MYLHPWLQARPSVSVWIPLPTSTQGQSLPGKKRKLLTHQRQRRLCWRLLLLPPRQNPIRSQVCSEQVFRKAALRVNQRVHQSREPCVPGTGPEVDTLWISVVGFWETFPSLSASSGLWGPLGKDKVGARKARDVVSSQTRAAESPPLEAPPDLFNEMIRCLLIVSHAFCYIPKMTLHDGCRED